MNRAELLRTLRIVNQVTVAPGGGASVPVFACLWFDGETVSAYDGTVAISSPLGFNAPIKGGVSGKALIDFLSACTSDNAMFKEHSSGVKVTAGKASMRLAVHPLDECPFEFPGVTKKPALTVSKDREVWSRGLNACLASMTVEPSGWDAGITVSVGENGVTLYSTNQLAMSRAELHVSTQMKLQGRAVQMPAQFCALLAKHIESAERIRVLDDGVDADIDGGVRLFGRIGSEVDVNGYESIIGTVDWKPKGFVGIPEEFEQCLNRSMVVVKEFSLFKLDGTSLKMRTTNEDNGNEIKDSIALGQPHAKLEVLASPAVILAALPYCEDIQFTEERIALTGDGGKFQHLIGIVRADGEEIEEETE